MAKFTADLKEANTSFISPVVDQSGALEAKAEGLEAMAGGYEALGEGQASAASSKFIGDMAEVGAKTFFAGMEAKAAYDYSSSISDIEGDYQQVQEDMLGLNTMEVKSFEDQMRQFSQMAEMGTRAQEIQARAKAAYKAFVNRYPHRKGVADIIYDEALGGGVGDFEDKSLAAIAQNAQDQLDYFKSEGQRLGVGEDFMDTPQGVQEFMKRRQNDQLLTGAKLYNEMAKNGVVPTGGFPPNSIPGVRAAAIDGADDAYNGAFLNVLVAGGMQPELEAMGINPGNINMPENMAKMQSLLTNPAFIRNLSNLTPDAVAEMRAGLIQQTSMAKQMYLDTVGGLDITDGQKNDDLAYFESLHEMIDSMMVQGADPLTIQQNVTKLQEARVKAETGNNPTVRAASVMASMGIEVPFNQQAAVFSIIKESATNPETGLRDLVSWVSDGSIKAADGSVVASAPQLMTEEQKQDVLYGVLDDMKQQNIPGANILVGLLDDRNKNNVLMSDPDSTTRILDTLTSEKASEYIAELNPDEQNVVLDAIDSVMEMSNNTLNSYVDTLMEDFPEAEVTINRYEDGKVVLDVYHPAFSNGQFMYNGKGLNQWAKARDKLTGSNYAKFMTRTLNAYENVFGTVKDFSGINKMRAAFEGKVTMGVGFEEVIKEPTPETGNVSGVKMEEVSSGIPVEVTPPDFDNSIDVEQRVSDMLDETGVDATVDSGPDYMDALAMIESSNDPNAKAKTSSATGLHQFIDSTWLDMVDKVDPQWAEGMSDKEILAQRTNPERSKEMAKAFTAENSQALQRAGIEPTEGKLYLSHFLGVTRALKTISAGPDALLTDVMPARVIKANKGVFSKLKTVQDLLDWADGKVEKAYKDLGKQRSAANLTEMKDGIYQTEDGVAVRVMQGKVYDLETGEAIA